MKKINLYIESDTTAPRAMKRRAGYILEYIGKDGAPKTREHFEETHGTYHYAVLTQMISAINRINTECEVHLYTRNEYVKNMITNHLPEWAENGFLNKKGDEIKNAQEWKALWEGLKKHKIITESNPHEYFAWMQEEMKNPERFGKYQK